MSFQIGDKIAYRLGKENVTITDIETRGNATFYILSNGKKLNEHQLMDNSARRNERSFIKGKPNG